MKLWQKITIGILSILGFLTIISVTAIAIDKSFHNTTCTMDKISSIVAARYRSVDLLLASGRTVSISNSQFHINRTYYIGDNVCIFPDGRIDE